jgi:ABC-type transport system involved in multi-copper enzyme maturation permease subunit
MRIAKQQMVLWPLTERVLRERWKGLAGWIGGLVALITIQVSVYPTIRDSREGWSELTEQFPEAFRKMFRMQDYTSPVGYLSTELFSFMIPLIFIGLAATWGARAGAEEEENDTADVLLSLPLSRSSILATRMMSTALVIVCTLLITTGVLWAGTNIANMDVAVSRILQASIACGLLAMVFGGFAVAFATWSGRRGVGLGAGLGLAIAAFVLYSLAPLVSALEHLLPINPFEWTISKTPLQDGLDPLWSVVAAAVSLVLGGVAAVAYQRHDIAS